MMTLALTREEALRIIELRQKTLDQLKEQLGHLEPGVELPLVANPKESLLTFAIPVVATATKPRASGQRTPGRSRGRIAGEDKLLSGQGSKLTKKQNGTR